MKSIKLCSGLSVTAHYAERIVTVDMRVGSASAETVGQGEVGGVIYRILCTWQLLGLAVKGPWLTQGGPILALLHKQA